MYDLTPGFDSSDCGDMEINCVMVALVLGKVRSSITRLSFSLLLALNHETVFIDHFCAGSGFYCYGAFQVRASIRPYEIRDICTQN